MPKYRLRKIQRGQLIADVLLSLCSCFSELRFLAYKAVYYLVAYLSVFNIDLLKYKDLNRKALIWVLYIVIVFKLRLVKMG